MLTLALFLIALPAAGQDGVEDLKEGECMIQKTEAKDSNNLICMADRTLTVDQKPNFPVRDGSVALASIKAGDLMMITVVSEEWNFHEANTAYVIVDGERRPFKAVPLNQKELDSGRVIEQFAIEITTGHSNTFAYAETIRIMIGEMVIDVSDTLPTAADLFLSMK